jgi:8-oxo-dGTP diphosphatase
MVASLSEGIVFVAGHINEALLRQLVTTLNEVGSDVHFIWDACTSDDLTFATLGLIQEKEGLQLVKTAQIKRFILCKHPKMYTFAKSAATCTVIVFLWAGTPWARLLVIDRAFDPFKGCVAFPGGFLDSNCETLSMCGSREGWEEVHLTIPIAQMILVGEDSSPTNDERDHVVSVCMAWFVPPGQEEEVIRQAEAGDDAKEHSVRFIRVREALKLGMAFNHADFLRMALALPEAQSFQQLLWNSSKRLIQSLYRTIASMFTFISPEKVRAR